MAVGFSLVEDSKTGRRYILSVTGELDARTIRKLGEWFGRATGAGARVGVVVDLTAVTRPDPSCIEVLVDKTRSLAGEGRAVRVVARGPLIDDLEAAGLGPLAVRDRREAIRGMG